MFKEMTDLFYDFIRNDEIQNGIKFLAGLFNIMGTIIKTVLVAAFETLIFVMEKVVGAINSLLAPVRALIDRFKDLFGIEKDATTFFDTIMTGFIGTIEVYFLSNQKRCCDSWYNV